ncbi:hypothetical protein [Phormidium sp. FACHB-592]|uniref:hypothetical protein n=1 Tax=Phormidium sp. FACHB-592 TaxID=2692850 RepID=UPI001A7E7689|nr:hypothetical protein [Phormidium sp. FACHB-592]
MPNYGALRGLVQFLANCRLPQSTPAYLDRSWLPGSLALGQAIKGQVQTDKRKRLIGQDAFLRLA